MTLGPLLQRLRRNRRLNLPEMAAALNSTPQTLAQIEAGKAFPPAAQRRAWAAALGFADLLDFDSHWRPPLGGSPQSARPTPNHLIPIINAVPAGPPVDYHEFGIDTSVGIDYVPRSADPAQQTADFLFAVIVVGDSMSPTYDDGDLVIFRPLAADEDLPDGQAVFIRFAANRDHTCTFKRIFRTGGDERQQSLYELRPDNPVQASVYVRPEEIDRIAIAIERRPAYASTEIRRVTDQYAQTFAEE